MIRRRIREGQPFMFLDEGLAAAGPVPSTNNLVESWNARLRDMPRRHRGLRLVRRLKAMFLVKSVFRVSSLIFFGWGW